VHGERIFAGLPLFKSNLVHLAALAALNSVSVAALACEQLRMEPGGTVTAVTDGDTVILDDGRVVRMIGTQAPKLPLDRPDFDTWPLAPEAKLALEALALNRPVRLGFGGESVDRQPPGARRRRSGCGAPRHTAGALNWRTPRAKGRPRRRQRHGPRQTRIIRTGTMER